MPYNDDPDPIGFFMACCVLIFLVLTPAVVFLAWVGVL